MPAADIRLELETGSVKLTSPFYLRRMAGSEVEEHAAAQGTTTIVKGPRQIGKSSPMAHVWAQAIKREQRSCYLDFKTIETPDLESLDKLLRRLASEMAEQLLGIQDTLTLPWNDKLGPGHNLSNYLEKAILAHSKSAVLMVFDDADRVFQFPYRDDFFTLIRGWHDKRATNDLWCRLNLIIAHSTEPHLWIQNVVERSPFNVGLRLTLDDFDLEGISQLNARHGHPLKTSGDIQQLSGLVAGHPYLIRRGLYALARNKWSIAQL
ncbi:MAG: AAA-like domain-containing protein [Nitrospiraceae bacterium]|nr:AAA-like domain-containing protein [Nitrospiraceae bacterium]